MRSKVLDVMNEVEGNTLRSLIEPYSFVRMWESESDNELRFEVEFFDFDELLNSTEEIEEFVEKLKGYGTVSAVVDSGGEIDDLVSLDDEDVVSVVSASESPSFSLVVKFMQDWESEFNDVEEQDLDILRGDF